MIKYCLKKIVVVYFLSFVLMACQTSSQLIWSKKIPAPQPSSALAFIDHYLFYIDNGKGINRVNLNNQELVQKELLLSPYNPLSVSQNLIYCTDKSGKLLVLNKNLEIVKSIALGLQIQSPISFEKQVCYFLAKSQSNNGKIYAYDIKQEKIVWESEHYVSMPLGNTIKIFPDELVFTGANSLYRVDKKTGKSIAFYDLFSSQNSYQGNLPQPTYNDHNDVYVGSTGSNIYGFSLNNKRLIWISALNKLDQKVYAKDQELVYDWDEKKGQIIAREFKTGNIRWTYDTSGKRVTAIGKNNNTLFIGVDKQLITLNNKGAEINKTPLQDEVIPNFGIHNRQLFFASQDFYLHCYQF